MWQSHKCVSVACGNLFWAVAAARSKVAAVTVFPREARRSAILDEVWTTDPFPFPEFPEGSLLCSAAFAGPSARGPQWRPALFAPLHPLS